VGDQLVSTNCVAFAMREYFDIGTRNLIRSADEQLRLFRSFFDAVDEHALLAAMHGAHPLLREGGGGQAQRDRRRAFIDELRAFNTSTGCVCAARGMLLRAHEHLLCRLGEHIRFDPLLIVRTDLLRWSLSLYSDFKEGLQRMPQFIQNYTPPRVHYDIKLLEWVASNVAIPYWKSKANAYRTLTRCGLRPRLLSSELFDETQLLQSSLRLSLLPCTRGLSTTLESSQLRRSVQRIHPNRISAYVSNAAEVFAHFGQTAYPSFAQLLAATKGGNTSGAFFT